MGTDGDKFWRLWLRHREWIERAARSGRAAGLRPRRYPTELFASEVLGLVQRKLRRDLTQFQGTGEIHAFLARVVENAARDVRRAWLRRPDAPGHAKVRESEVRHALWGSDALASSLAVYRGRTVPPQDSLLEQRDLRERFTGAWQHARTSTIDGPWRCDSGT